METQRLIWPVSIDFYGIDKERLQLQRADLRYPLESIWERKGRLVANVSLSKQTYINLDYSLLS